MKILVAAKQVLDPETNIKVDEGGRWISPVVMPRYQLNQFDEYAVEEAVSLKASIPGTEVHVISVGPERVKGLIERVMGMGADHGVIIDLPDHGYISPLTPASLIASYASSKNYDLVLFGVMAEDDMQGQVGPLTAELLDLPLATSVMKLDVSEDDQTVRVEREVEAGRRETLALRTPAVLTIQSGINKPRYPTLSGLLRAKKYKPEVIVPEGSETSGVKEEVVWVGLPKKTRAGLVLEGDTAGKASRLLSILKEKAFL